MLRRILDFIGWPAPRPNDAFTVAYTKFYNEMLGYGMEPDKIDEEFVLRRAHARIRRIVSAQTLKQPQRYQEYLASAIKSEGYTLQKLNKKLGFDFLKIMKGFQPEQILTPDAWIAYVEYGESVYINPRIDEDSMAALSLNYRR